jgi:hypothetical protein
MFRFSIRDMLWVTLVVAVAVGWFCHYRATDANRRAVIQHAGKLKETLGFAKRHCEQLEQDVELKSAGLSYMGPRKYWKVDWTVLDEPIPSAQR